MNRKFRNALSLLLAMLMIMTTLPTFVLANETADDEGDGFSLFSLLPIDEVELTANLVIASASEKSEVYIGNFLSVLEDEDGPCNIWPNYILWNDNYDKSIDDPSFDPSFRIVDYDDIVDLSALSSGDKIMFIGGNSSSQFDKNNIRYIVTVNFESLPSFAYVELYSGTVSEVTYITGNRATLNGETAWLWLPPNSELSANYRLALWGVPATTDYYTAKVYKGTFATESGIPTDPAADVTTAIFGDDGLPTSFVADVAQQIGRAHV